MFQFTTTTVINSSVWDGQKDARWSFQEADEEKGIPATANIKGVGIFKAPNITGAYKAEGYEGTIGSFTVKIPAQNKGDHMRLSFTIKLSEANNDSLYSNDYYYKGKKFYVDFYYGDNSVQTALELEKMIKNMDLNVYDRKIWNVKATGGSVTITGVNCYQQFKDVKLEVIKLNDRYAREDAIEVDGDPTYVASKDDFLTSDYITRNLRLPTYARTNYTAFNKHENPIEGELYNQYTIHYCAKRGQLGLNAVGQEVTSTTTHVFFVLQSLSAKFEDLLTSVLADSDVELETIEPKNP